jgi:hypothetical protein
MLSKEHWLACESILAVKDRAFLGKTDLGMTGFENAYLPPRPTRNWPGLIYRESRWLLENKRE